MFGRKDAHKHMKEKHKELDIPNLVFFSSYTTNKLGIHCKSRPYILNFVCDLMNPGMSRAEMNCYPVENFLKLSILFPSIDGVI